MSVACGFVFLPLVCLVSWMPTGHTVNAPYRLATPESTAAAETPERVCDGWGAYTRASRKQCVQACLWAQMHMRMNYVMIFCMLECLCWMSGPWQWPSTGAAWRTTQLSCSSDQLLLSGCPMWFHLDRQGLQLQSADSLSGHRVGVVQGKGPTELAQ